LGESENRGLGRTSFPSILDLHAPFYGSMWRFCDCADVSDITSEQSFDAGPPQLAESTNGP
jgi:hypothetical protein